MNNVKVKLGLIKEGYELGTETASALLETTLTTYLTEAADSPQRKLDAGAYLTKEITSELHSAEVEKQKNGESDDYKKLMARVERYKKQLSDLHSPVTARK